MNLQDLKYKCQPVNLSAVKRHHLAAVD